MSGQAELGGECVPKQELGNKGERSYENDSTKGLWFLVLMIWSFSPSPRSQAAWEQLGIIGDDHGRANARDRDHDCGNGHGVPV